MLAFERRVVGALVTATDPPTRSAVEGFVDESLRVMPEVIRFGVAAQSLAIGTVARLDALVRPGDDGLERRLSWLERSPIGPLRQYVRLFRSLVVFAENEMANSAA